MDDELKPPQKIYAIFAPNEDKLHIRKWADQPFEGACEYVLSSTPESRDTLEAAAKDLEEMRVEMLERNIFGWPNIVKDVIETIRNRKGEA